jgi:drug/metabolite transporter, DME family
VRAHLPYSHRKGLLQVVCAGVLWGTGGLAMQLLRDQDPISPLAVIAWRAVIGAGVSLLLLVALGRLGELVALVRRHPLRVLAVGTGTATFQALFFLAVPMAGVAVATMVGLGLAPVLLTVYDAFRLRQAPGIGRAPVLATALIGLILVSVVAGEAGTGPRPFAGVLLAAASATIFAITTVAVGGRISRDVSPLVLTNAMAVVGVLVLSPTILLVDGPVSTRDAAAWAWLLYLGIFTIVVGWVLLYSALRVTTASTAVTAMLVEPVTAALAAAVVLQEPLGVLGATGIVLVLVGVAGLGRPVVTAGPVVSPDDPAAIRGGLVAPPQAHQRGGRLPRQQGRSGRTNETPPN